MYFCRYYHLSCDVVFIENRVNVYVKLNGQNYYNQKNYFTRMISPYSFQNKQFDRLNKAWNKNYEGSRQKWSRTVRNEGSLGLSSSVDIYLSRNICLLHFCSLWDLYSLHCLELRLNLILRSRLISVFCFYFLLFVQLRRSFWFLENFL